MPPHTTAGETGPERKGAIVPWLSKDEAAAAGHKLGKCPTCGKPQREAYRANESAKFQPGCQQCHRDRDATKRAARKAEPVKVVVIDEEPVEEKPKRRPRKTGEASGTAKAIARNRKASTASA